MQGTYTSGASEGNQSNPQQWLQADTPEDEWV